MELAEQQILGKMTSTFKDSLKDVFELSPPIHKDLVVLSEVQVIDLIIAFPPVPFLLRNQSLIN